MSKQVSLESHSVNVAMTAAVESGPRLAWRPCAKVDHLPPSPYPHQPWDRWSWSPTPTLALLEHFFWLAVEILVPWTCTESVFSSFSCRQCTQMLSDAGRWHCPWTSEIMMLKSGKASYATDILPKAKFQLMPFVQTTAQLFWVLEHNTIIMHQKSKREVLLMLKCVTSDSLKIQVGNWVDCLNMHMLNF